jgi:hypothetical protein
MEPALIVSERKVAERGSFVVKDGRQRVGFVVAGFLGTGTVA